MAAEAALATGGIHELHDAVCVFTATDVALDSAPAAVACAIRQRSCHSGLFRIMDDTT